MSQFLNGTLDGSVLCFLSVLYITISPSRAPFMISLGCGTWQNEYNKRVGLECRVHKKSVKVAFLDNHSNLNLCNLLEMKCIAVLHYSS